MVRFGPTGHHPPNGQTSLLGERRMKNRRARPITSDVRASRGIVALVGLLLTAATGVLAVIGFAADTSRVRDDQADAQRAAAHAFEAELEETVESARELAALYAASREVTAAEFEIFARPLLDGVNASGFSWVQYVTTHSAAGSSARRVGSYSMLGRMATSYRPAGAPTTTC